MSFRMQDIWKLIISLAALVAIAFQLALTGGQLNIFTLGLFVIAMLPWVWSGIETLRIAGVLDLRTRNIQADINTLKFIVSHLITEGERKILNKLTANDQFIIGPEPTLINSPLIGELRHLLGLGFIDRTDSFSEFQNRGMREKVKVEDYFKITATGKEYLSLWHSINTETPGQEDKS